MDSRGVYNSVATMFEHFQHDVHEPKVYAISPSTALSRTV